MDNSIPPSSIVPIKPPVYRHEKEPVDKKKYLDELYTSEWLQTYFNMTPNQ